MNKFYAILWLIFFLFFQNLTMHSQTTIAGKVTAKETGEDMILANVVVSKAGVFITSETTDIDGDYKIRVDEGSYDLEVSCPGYATRKIKGITVDKDKTKKVDVELREGRGNDFLIINISYKIPLIRQDETSTELTITSERIRILPTRNINEMSSMSPGVSFRQ